MGTVALFTPNLVDTATISGGSWTAGAPLANLLDRRVKKIARAANNSSSSTQFTLDLITSQPIRLAALTGHNLNEAATHRVRFSNVSDFSVVLHDSGTINAWIPSVTAAQTAYLPKTIIYVAPSNVTARYVKWEFFTTVVPEFGRPFVGAPWQPALNMAYGSSVGYESRSRAQETPNGTDYYDAQLGTRIVRFTLDSLSESEAMNDVIRIQRQADTYKEIFFMWDLDDTAYRLQRSFLAHARTLNPIEHPYFNTHSTAFELREII